MKCLIIGGSSGLGFNLATRLMDKYSVTVTGRTDPKHVALSFKTLDLKGDEDPLEAVQALVGEQPHVDLLIYNPGFFQDGTITDVPMDDIRKMLNVGLTAAIYLTREILAKQNELSGFIAVTSTSQWTPRLREPVYTAVKAGLAAYASSLSLDPRVKKTLVAGPAGMDTGFWEGTTKDTSHMLDHRWVGGEILGLWQSEYSYKFAQILNGPPRTEVMETRK